RALRGETYVLLQGLENLTIVTRQGHIAKLEELFGDELIESKRSLAGIFVKSPPEIVSTSGVLARLSSLLAAEGINVVEMMSSYVETIFLVEERDCLRGIEAIREEIKRARGSE
ncbi:ACT domain-containing protein, partial [Candidatus Pyrohabitans sp.]